MTETIIVGKQFNGPPGSGHGGYVAGVVGELLGGAVEVTLRSRPPLETEMTVRRADDSISVFHGDTLVAEARRTPLDVAVPPAPDASAVDAAERHFNEFKKDDFHLCFACGAGRREGDGLRLLTGPVAGGEAVAAHWVPHPGFADTDGRIPPRILWSALDCPGGWSLIRDTGVIMLLGRFTADVDDDLTPGTPCTVLGWPLGRDGRKAYAGTAIYDASGQVRGRASAVWIDIGKRV